MNISVGVGWASEFDRAIFQRIFYRRLRYAYRAPTLFLQGMMAGGARLSFFKFDENLNGEDLSHFNGDIDILYLSTHGMVSTDGYRIALNARDWSFLPLGLGDTGPPIVIFDTCSLVGTGEEWVKSWQKSPLGRSLCLVLGFSTPATVSVETSLRGQAFAREILDGRPIADAWMSSIVNTTYSGTDEAVAIAIGADRPTAIDILENATLWNMPQPRPNTDTTVVVRR